MFKDIFNTDVKLKQNRLETNDFMPGPGHIHCLQSYRTTLCISADRLPRHPTASSRPPKPHYSWPFGPLLHGLSTTPASHQPNPAALQHTSHTVHFSVHHLSPLLHRGCDVRTPAWQQPLYHTAHLLPLLPHISRNHFSSQQLSPCSVS